MWCCFCQRSVHCSLPLQEAHSARCHGQYRALMWQQHRRPTMQLTMVCSSSVPKVLRACEPQFAPNSSPRGSMSQNAEFRPPSAKLGDPSGTCPRHALCALVRGRMHGTADLSVYIHATCGQEQPGLQACTGRQCPLRLCRKDSDMCPPCHSRTGFPCLLDVCDVAAVVINIVVLPTCWIAGLPPDGHVLALPHSATARHGWRQMNRNECVASLPLTCRSWTGTMDSFVARVGHHMLLGRVRAGPIEHAATTVPSCTSMSRGDVRSSSHDPWTHASAWPVSRTADACSSQQSSR